MTMTMTMTFSELCFQIRMPIKRDKEGVIIEITLTDDEEEELDEEAAAKKKKEEEDAKTEVGLSKIIFVIKS